MKHHILDKTFWVYTAIAVACWCVGTGLMFLLYNCLHVGYWIASACNYLVGGTMSYFLNRKYTFHSHDNRPPWTGCARRSALPFQPLPHCTAPY